MENAHPQQHSNIGRAPKAYRIGSKIERANSAYSLKSESNVSSANQSTTSRRPVTSYCRLPKPTPLGASKTIVEWDKPGGAACRPKSAAARISREMHLEDLYRNHRREVDELYSQETPNMKEEYMKTLELRNLVLRDIATEKANTIGIVQRRHFPHRFNSSYALPLVYQTPPCEKFEMDLISTPECVELHKRRQFHEMIKNNDNNVLR